jgi:hypothetical protein
MIEIVIEELLFAIALSKNKGIEVAKITFELNESLVIEIK